jgi:apolipoprotein N-acyltransferase
MALYRTVVLFALLPAAGAWLVARALAATVDVTPGTVRVARLGLRVEIPASAVARVVPWSIPLPGPGFSFVLPSGRPLRPGLQMRDPAPLLRALADTGGIEPARAALSHATVVWAHARATAGRRRRHHLVAKFPLFALLPTAVLFNAHQHIAYGATFGEYYTYGLGPYLETLAIYWSVVTIYCVLWASLWRGLGEGFALLAARVAPSRAAGVRRAVEVTCRLLYFGGIPALVALRFAPW